MVVLTGTPLEVGVDIFAQVRQAKHVVLADLMYLLICRYRHLKSGPLTEYRTKSGRQAKSSSFGLGLVTIALGLPWRREAIGRQSHVLHSFD